MSSLPFCLCRTEGLDNREGATIIEIVSKRKLYQFWLIRPLFNLPTGSIHDKDAPDFKENRDEEKRYNRELNSPETPDGQFRVWQLKDKYEDHVRWATGDQIYQEFSMKFPRILGKPTQQRLIAMTEGVPVPDPFGEILSWLVGKSSTPDA